MKNELNVVQKIKSHIYVHYFFFSKIMAFVRECGKIW